jgi:hypothetical protein
MDLASFAQRLEAFLLKVKFSSKNTPNSLNDPILGAG